MDDDVLDTAASKGTPLRYRFKLACLGAGRKSWLLRQKAKIWVSTPYLLEKYSAWSAKLVPPSPVSGQPSCTVFYHGSATHDAEIRWLRPIVEEVLKLDERCSFEIVGGMDVYRLYHGLARVRVVHPMKWAAFQKFLALPGRTVGLVPVLDTRFNKARSYTKFFDITRSGAAGIYTRGSIFGSIVNHEVDGLLQENDPEQWIESILDLLADAGLREKMVRNAKRRAEELRLSAQESYTCLC
ncbi:hypothetical protein Q8A64_17750 [Oxalobacteraceae bacterium R-40]|uniref:Uncharacterized protein n=1 Tax=Keguizhuia sedimenti TaxID=3064264 RepID=A0ABU1BTB1_9BURK|nr:hypothetical protein [Oxalobacteraceae bacterium R-40]